ncbi:MULTISPECIES: N-acetyl-gamma-glutamyl-phosphate reductase [Gammaproteobacteria]|uniref:N-acetyl-gamma-glutamyl-phosphate reductase n=1 Tax=Gammaproteobacteria TaxID=1236 RepID=UPI000DD00BB4|nr:MULTISPECIES: N-acetyl-gamma-glutamyl-phosphate reductase [Gammaproteobacteria]RTE87347.1 N-acetyl-gamma-glutamyl-phosphate reductase [Aliidiomarina sp. B3213]TCZ92867.1 N-acetyl-gamma-glutamyl-phosphate reductase [Lysobacter sp. N42]
MKCVVFGAAGYAGAELVECILRHKQFELVRVFGSHESGLKSWHKNVPHKPYLNVDNIYPATEEAIKGVDFDVAFLALPHEASFHWASFLVEQGVRVFDLSGAFRLQNVELTQQVYGLNIADEARFQHVPYMLMPWFDKSIKGSLFSIPGCYPTASLLALKPLVEHGLISSSADIGITGISGVSGAGKAPSERNSFCEVSIQPYGLLNHRHEPEISIHLGIPVHFTPVISAIPRGLLVVIDFKLKDSATTEQLTALYNKTYKDHALVHVVEQAPAAHHVAHTPYCHVSIHSRGSSGVVVAAIDNLMMGAATQALEAANVVCGFSRYEGIIK